MNTTAAGAQRPVVMTDRELLELAAKAAGVEHVTPLMIEWGKWNPLTDDGDALRLAVRLKMVVEIDGALPEQQVGGFCYAFTTQVAAEEPAGSDPYAATRRVIVRAAAEIGRTMP